MNATLTPPVCTNSKEVLKLLIPITGNRELIESLSKKGVLVTVDEAKTIACASFANVIDYNLAKSLLA